jgi:hypothetical protein
MRMFSWNKVEELEQAAVDEAWHFREAGMK